MLRFTLSLFFFFNDTATTEIYTLSLHDALPIFEVRARGHHRIAPLRARPLGHPRARDRTRWVRHGVRREPHDVRSRRRAVRSEEHTSELQSRRDLVCRLLLEKKKEK